ncbi:arsenite methyltransferase [Prolixibacter denitrificans]|uniref:Arsenite methyltransferase n=1 Tax=Prolixibacter denitrificans TaxID=1541063 RepID=A0A2P8C799_9BACT|nr:arsenite methyltransferase [Prolixibacter denitrificans]PSK80797.1 ubiquinone/menaquinone biosynthesis C-methylase UbiE [Prolixibacter denitrificans]GET22403.1 arsenite S-adenosylmethyltransferase [Prolixibacter denitrificans]
MQVKPEDLKLLVQEKYGEIASQSKEVNQSSCCGGTSCCGDSTYTIFSDDYTMLKGYNADADLGLGCGLPTEFARISKGDHVLDLGSGAGNDCFVARAITGETGKVTGLDFTDAMLEKARKNLEKTGFTNVEFVKGDIEEMPLPENTFDVVISNCVLNLVPDKEKAFSGIFRVLKPGGHFCISDVVLDGVLPEGLIKEAEMYAGCVSGAIQREQYLSIIEEKGFSDIKVEKNKAITIPDDILSNYLSEQEMEEYKTSGTGIFSITVTANK